MRTFGAESLVENEGAKEVCQGFVRMGGAELLEVAEREVPRERRNGLADFFRKGVVNGLTARRFFVGGRLRFFFASFFIYH